MGRYYKGDINGKFWFGVQASNAADRFGVEGCEPNYLTYYFSENDTETVKEEIDSIKETIGEENIKLIDSFFDSVDCYNDQTMEKFHPDLLHIWNKHKSDYADLRLGLKIYNHLLTNTYCKFTAEL